MRKWQIARTEPNREHTAKRSLEHSKITTFLPVYFKRFPNRHTRLKLLFSNYIFFSLDDHRQWPEVQRLAGIQEVLTFSDPNSPYRVPRLIESEAIESLRAQALAIEDGGSRQSYITPGCFVRIIAGNFAGEDRALVDWADGDRAFLLMSLFNRTVRVEFFQKDLELIK